MISWQDFDLDATIQDYDYTKRAAVRIKRILDSHEFEDMDAEMIFNYLRGEIEIVIFSDFLKRYIYRKARIGMPFHEVPDEVYKKIISESMTENAAPYSLVPTSVKKSVAINDWLANKTVRRSTVFVLGFVLKMPHEDVTKFLTKVIKETDFDFTDPEETVYWFCYKRELPYARAKKILDEYGKMPVTEFSEKIWSSMNTDPKFFLSTSRNLQLYLSMLKSGGIALKKENTAHDEFCRLFEECRRIIADIETENNKFEGRDKVVGPEEIQAGDLERELCSGIPLNSQGNLERMTKSSLGALFENKRMSRSRIRNILLKKQKTERFDIITLNFFIHAMTSEPDDPKKRFTTYIDNTNEILRRCGMEDIYPVNAYEAFVLMCIVSDYPIDVYAEIWERSYQPEQGGE